jgi:hypothetical protein
MSYHKVYPNVNIFTVYVGLTASGYDMAQYSSNDPMYDVTLKIQDFQWSQQILDYFRIARTNTCEVNPYWPRAYLLAFSSLYISDDPEYRYTDPDGVVKRIEELKMINPADKQPDTLNWLMELPSVYTIIRSQRIFEDIWNLYLETINVGQYEKEAFEAISSIVNQVGVTPNQLPRIIIVPNPLQAMEVTDFAMANGNVYVIKAQPDSSSIIHEILHYLFEPILESCDTMIERFHHLLTPVLDKMIRLQYAWADDLPSWNRVFEENLMRSATIWITYRNDPNVAHEIADHDTDYGFVYVPIILRQFIEKWSDLANFEPFIQECLQACESIR